MKRLNYSIQIAAPKEKVWHTMLDPESYKQWTAAFNPGSYYIGSWDKGAKITFVSEEDGGQSGLVGEIEENVPYEFISIRTLAELVDGTEDTTSPDALLWIGSHENYRFSEVDGMTTVDVELTSETLEDEMQEMFDGMWPKSLARLKEVAES